MAERHPEKFWLGCLLLLASAATHFMWLSYPHQVVFDEVHFGKFVTAYCCTGERFFDIHPPHAKLLIAGTAKLTGFNGGLSFEQIGQSYGSLSPLPLRFVPALAGTFLPLVIFIFLLQLGASRAAAFFGAAAVLLDNALTVQTRIISLDGLLLLSIFGSLSLWFMAERASSRRLLLTAAAGGAAGLAVGVKFTGLVAPGMLAALWVLTLFRRRDRSRLAENLRLLLAMAAGALIVYGAGWALHFYLLPQPGPGDAWRVPRFESPVAVSFVRETAALHRIMFDANYGLDAKHPDESAWWEWPLMRTSVFYWQAAGGDGRTAAIYLLGNPLLWWGSTVLLVSLASDVVSRRLFSPAAWRQAGLANLWIPLAGYAIALAPLVKVPRALFLYHYLTPLIFAIVAIVLWLDAGGFFKPGSVMRQPRYYFAVLGALALAFLVFSPLTYGFLVPPVFHSWLFWLPTWR
jgi:dolichyl-phosphate-mannose-protein mannosyltransferase